MADICGDNRFKIIESAKQRLVEATNIESRPEEMAVIDSILFRMWQMHWLPGCERAERTCRLDTNVMGVSRCSECRSFVFEKDNYCSNCGAKVVK